MLGANPNHYILHSVYRKRGFYMKFNINNDEWTIISKDASIMLEKYKKEYEEDAYYVRGITIYSQHEIWLNKDMCKEQIIRTLKHELTHCFIFNYGMYNVPNFNEEMACDLVASINDFINEVVEEFKKEMEKNSHE